MHSDHDHCPSNMNHASRISSKNSFLNSYHDQCSSKTNHASRAASNNLSSYSYHSKLNHVGRKKIRMPASCIIILYHRLNLWPRNSSPIAIIRHIRKEDLITLIFLNLLSEVEINSVDINANSSKDPPEISECYRNFVDVFSKKEVISLSPHWDHLDHHILLMNDTKFIFDSI